MINRLHHLLRRPGRGRRLRVTAVISVWRDEPYLDRCFRNMAEHGIRAIVIDNDANEATKAIVARYTPQVVQRVVHFPNTGVFDWTGILRLKEELVNSEDSDWFMMWDTDEIRDPPASYPTLLKAFAAVEAKGYNAVQFNEFVFVPVTPEEDYAGRDYVEELRTYYYFHPHGQQRLNAWRKPAGPVDLMTGAGHFVSFDGIKPFPEPFALRHYLFLSYAHGLNKYVKRLKISEEDLAKGWMHERERTTENEFKLPDAGMMNVKEKDGPWDTSDPLKRHPFFVYPDGPA
jgi:hypothetical protein